MQLKDNLGKIWTQSRVNNDLFTRTEDGILFRMKRKNLELYHGPLNPVN